MNALISRPGLIFLAGFVLVICSIPLLRADRPDRAPWPADPLHLQEGMLRG